MAAKTWLGNDAGNLGDASVAANWSPSGVSGAADDLYFADSTQGVTAGLTALATINLTSLNIHPTYTGSIGATGTPFVVANCTDIRFRGGGLETWLQADAVTTCQVRGSATGSDAFSLEGDGSLVITDLDVSDAYAGGCTITNGTITDVLMAGCVGSSLLTIEDDVTVNGDFQADTGRSSWAKVSGLDSFRAIGTHSATIVTGAGTFPAAGVLHASDAATIAYDSDGDVDGVTEVWGSAQITCRNNQTAGTVTFAALKAINGGTFDKRSSFANIVVTSESSFEGVILPEV